MREVRYIISDAAKQVSVEPHVLRYWEEELELNIPRNEMGHRYYREKDIEMLKMVKQLKDKGFQLRAIKMEVDDMEKAMEKGMDKSMERPLRKNLENTNIPEETPSISYGITKQQEPGALEPADTDHEDRMIQFRMIMSDIIGQAIKENNQDLSTTVTNGVSETIVKEMDYLVREKEEKEEARYQKLDELIREIQKNRSEAAATQMEAEKAEKKKRKGFFRKK